MLKLANKLANIPTVIKSLCLRDGVIWFIFLWLSQSFHKTNRWLRPISMTDTSDSNDVHHHLHKVNFMPNRKTCDFSMRGRFQGLRLWNPLYIAKKNKKRGQFWDGFFSFWHGSTVGSKHVTALIL